MIPPALLLISCVLLVLSLLWPPFPAEQILQHVPTSVAILLLAIVAKRRWLSTTAFACLVAFLWLHILGARYIYSYVPYDAWMQSILEGSPTAWFGWRRNHYDRLVHFCFGLLVLVPTTEVAVSFGDLNRYWAIGFAACFIAALSAGYEIFEWLLTVAMSPEAADAYNGQQGDPWNAQKDMALAMIGAAMA